MSCCEEEAKEPEAPARRAFLAALLGGLAGLGPLLVGALAVFDPLRRRRAQSSMVRVANLDRLPVDGSPARFTLETDRVDAWTTFAKTPVGAVYLRRTEDGVRALNAVCPHAGCFVGIVDGGRRFACPCHKSSFDLDGVVNDPASPSPRDMDELDVELRNGNEVWVRYQSFLAGRHDKVPV